jgi:hypothetical protein
MGPERPAEEWKMSELETARAGVFLSLLALTLTWVLLGSDEEIQPSAEPANPLLICASTHGAVCEAPAALPGNAPGAVADAADSGAALVGEIAVTASRLPADLGQLVVVASRLPAEPFAKVQLAKARDSRRDARTTVVQ